MAGENANSTNDTKAAKADGGKAAAAAEPPTQYQFAQKPEELPGWEGFKQFLWNSEKKELEFARVPNYAWNELMAEQTLFKAASYYPDYAAYMPLLAASLAGQIVETDLRVQLAKERTTPVEHPEEAAAAHV